MNFREWGASLQARLGEMQANRERESLIIASDLKALVQLRIQTSGENYRGSQFSPYSSQYAKTRQKAGAQTSYVDFTVTGQLWANIRPEITESTPTSTTVEIAARDKANIDKMLGALRQPKGAPRGNILLPSEDEVKFVQDAHLERVIKYIR